MASTNGHLRLVHFPLDILSQILSGRYSHLFIALWKCGDVNLNSKLSRCMQEVSLFDQVWTSTSRWPKVLSCLPNLRVLSVDRGNGNLMSSSKQLNAEIRKLPPSLLDLEIVSFEAELAFFNHSPSWLLEEPKYITTNYERGPSPLMDLEALFPALETLRVMGWDSMPLEPLGGQLCLPALPKSLTRLLSPIVEPYKKSDIAMTSLAGVPPNLKEWRANLVYAVAPLVTSWLENANTSLERIFQVKDLPSQREMPSSLKAIDCGGYHLPLNLSKVRSLPPNYNRLPIMGINYDSFDPNTEWTEQVPRNIVHMTLYSCSKMFSLGMTLGLPTMLRSLEFSPTSPGLDWEGIAAFKGGPTRLWPPGLQIFTFGEQTTWNHFKALPRTVTRLAIRTDGPTTFSVAVEDLPPLITDLVLSYRLRSNHAVNASLELSSPLPEKLTKLTFDNWHFDLSMLPKSIMTFYYNFLEVSPFFKHNMAPIPQGTWIKHLEVNWWSWAWLDCLPVNLEFFSISMMHGYVKGFKAESRDLFGLLPPSLKCLYIDEELSPEHPPVLSGRHFSALPNLQKILFGSGIEFHSSVLRSIPKDIRTLEIIINDFKEEDAPFIPQAATRLRLCSDTVYEIPQVEKHVPLAAYSIGTRKGAKSEELIKRIQEARKRSKTYPDPRIMLP